MVNRGLSKVAKKINIMAGFTQYPSATLIIRSQPVIAWQRAGIHRQDKRLGRGRAFDECLDLGSMRRKSTIEPDRKQRVGSFT